MESWYIFTTKFSVMIPELVLSEFAPEPKAEKPCGWEGGMLSREGNNPAHPAVATQDAHAMWYCTLPCKNTVSHPARSGISSCSAATPLYWRHAKSQWTPPKHMLAGAKSCTLPLVLWTGRDRTTVAVLPWVCWPALNDPMSSVQEGTEVSLFWEIALDQPVSICSPDKKPLWGHFSVRREEMVQKEMLFPPLWTQSCVRRNHRSSSEVRARWLLSRREVVVSPTP